MRLNAANKAETKLTEKANASDTSFTVEDASVFPPVPFLITMNRNEEIVKVMDVNGNTLTVEREQEGTQASEWLADTVIYHNMTAGMYDDLVDKDYADSLSKYGGRYEWRYNEDTDSLDLVILS